jgi:cell division transport system permease protein
MEGGGDPETTVVRVARFRGWGSRRRWTTVALALVAAGGIAVGMLAARLLDEDEDGKLAVVDGCLDRFSKGEDAFVYVEPDATPREIKAIRERLAGDDRITSMEYLDQQATYVEFVRLFADSPGLIRTVEPDILPPSFRVDLEDVDTLSAFEDETTSIPRVYEVISQLDDAPAKLSPSAPDRCPD